MLITNGYCTIAELKARLGQDDTVDEATLKANIEAASRKIDQHCRRHFYARLATNYYTPDEESNRMGPDDGLLIDDLLAVTTFSHDADGDRVYEETWAATDYDLLPDNALFRSPPWPYTRIRLAPNGSYRFSLIQRAVKVVGKWGFYECLESLDTLAAAITTTTATTFTATAGSVYSAGQTILIDSEQMHVRSVSTNTVTVVRGVNGTTAATHLIATPVQVYTYPVVNEACLLLAARLFKRKDAIFGVMGSADVGIINASGEDRDVALLLSAFVRWM